MKQVIWPMKFGGKTPNANQIIEAYWSMWAHSTLKSANQLSGTIKVSNDADLIIIGAT